MKLIDKVELFLTIVIAFHVAFIVAFFCVAFVMWSIPTFGENSLMYFRVFELIAFTSSGLVVANSIQRESDKNES